MHFANAKSNKKNLQHLYFFHFYEVMRYVDTLFLNYMKLYHLHDNDTVNWFKIDIYKHILSHVSTITVSSISSNYNF